MTVTNHTAELARDRADELRRDRARARGRRPRAPGVRQPLRRDRVARVVFGRHRHAAAPLGGGAAPLVRARRGHGPGAGRSRHLRDRPRPLPRPRLAPPATRPRSPWTARSPARPARCSTRSSRSARACGWRPGSRPRWPSPPWSPPPGSAPSSSRAATTTRTRPSAPSTWRGPPSRWSCASSTSPRRTPPSSRSSPATSSIPARSTGAPQEELRRNRGSQPLLWANGISGDAPIVLATIDSPEGLPTLRQLFAAHHYWRRRGLTVDLVILNDAGRPRTCRSSTTASWRRCSLRATRDRPARRRLRPAARRAPGRGAPHAPGDGPPLRDLRRALPRPPARPPEAAGGDGAGRGRSGPPPGRADWSGARGPHRRVGGASAHPRRARPRPGPSGQRSPTVGGPAHRSRPPPDSPEPAALRFDNGFGGLTTRATTCCASGVTSCPRHPGRTSSPTRTAASSSASGAAGSPGRRTATSSGSRRGTTTP